MGALWARSIVADRDMERDRLNLSARNVAIRDGELDEHAVSLSLDIVAICDLTKFMEGRDLRLRKMNSSLLLSWFTHLHVST